MGCRATTHTDLQIRAHQKGIKVEVIHNASILNAVGACGLQLYRYGEVKVAHSISNVYAALPPYLMHLLHSAVVDTCWDELCCLQHKE